MRTKVTIKRRSDGVSRSFDDDFEWTGDEERSATSKAIWQWTEGNFCCDCNRALFFARAAGEPDPADVPCSENLFLVELRDLATDELFFAEMPTL